MTPRRFILVLATAVIAGGVALAASPAIAQGTPQATVYKFSLPGSVTPGYEKYSLPGDVVTKKSRGGVLIEKVSLADMVVVITRQAAKGHSIGGTITIKGATRPMRGLPVLLDDGSVKIRVAQGRGSRAYVLPRGGGAATGSTISCPPGTTASYDSKSGKYVCK
jgi:hypothetical protein